MSVLTVLEPINLEQDEIIIRENEEVTMVLFVHQSLDENNKFANYKIGFS
jgi:hypothetical protein